MTAVREPKTTGDSSRLVIEGRQGRYTALGFRSASVANREGRSYGSGSGDAHSRYDRPRLIKQSRAFYRDNAIYKGMIDRAVSYITGNGFELQVKTNSTSFNKKIERLWKDFQKTPEIRGLLSGAECSRMTLAEVMIAGDTGAIKTNKGLLQQVEAEQIASRIQARDGIEKNMFGAPVRFWVSPYNENGYLKSGSARKIDPADFLFITNPDRPSSTRGVPACQSSFPMLHRTNDACDSEAIAMQLLSRLVVSITRADGDQKAYLESKVDPAKAGTDTSGDLATRLTELSYAIMFHANPGEKIEGIERNIPGKNFSESVRMFLRLLGLPLGLPLEIILLDWTKSNYSQSRAVLEQAFQSFIFWQSKIADFYYSPLFEWKLQAWRESGLVGNRKDIPYSWIRPSYPWIDQLKEAKAKAEMVERGFMTHSEVCKSRSQDRAEVVEIRDKEVRDAIDRAVKIEADTGVNVPWQIFAGLKPPGTIAPPVEELPETDEKKEGQNA
jgi:capsid protein